MSSPSEKDKSDNLDALNNKTRAYKLHKEALQHIATSARYAHDRVIIGEQNTIFEDHMIKALAGERAARDELAAYVAVSGERKRLTVKLESAISSDEPTVSGFLSSAQLMATLNDLTLTQLH
ncbi:hypothetical protein HBH70_108510 [Parastagonospora nodorum]|nr:hypothetical protein HBH99_098700 [Parastagonospora nodorum]KAH5137712.1 hypothetical protein HBH70_108510 [Parastagonospora nodorum]